jgi:hypothetical protein
VRINPISGGGGVKEPPGKLDFTGRLIVLPGNLGHQFDLTVSYKNAPQRSKTLAAAYIKTHTHPNHFL